MRVLVVGCGSIGRRHIGNLLAMEGVSGVVVCTKNDDWANGIYGHGRIERIRDLDELVVPMEYSNEEVGAERLSFAIIANETYMHVDTATHLAARGLHLFIEKPLSHSMDGVDQLARIAEEHGVTIRVGYNLRFLGAIGYVKEALMHGRIGKPYFARIEVGQFLPFWRSNADYRKSYSASIRRGGGVALDLSHEIDYMCHLFGLPLRWQAMRSRASALEIDSEDIFEGIYGYDGGFVCSVHLDYLQPSPQRQIRIQGSEGHLLCDMIKKRIVLGYPGSAEILAEDPALFDISRSYVDELRDFVAVTESYPGMGATLEDGVNVLRLLGGDDDWQ